MRFLIICEMRLPVHDDPSDERNIERIDFVSEDALLCYHSRLLYMWVVKIHDLPVMACI